MPELITEVDESDRFLGLRPRDKFPDKKHIPRFVHLLLFNSQRKLLIHQRSVTKVWYPNLWTFSVSGTVAEESYEDAILRETQEELGILTSPTFLFKYLFEDDQTKAWRAVFTAVNDETVTPDPGEMQAIRWVSLAELKNELREKSYQFTGPFREGMKRFFEFTEKK